ncbi:MAG TPA: DUF1501 domain-containing protein [Thermoanaerobaculia bacterium]|jgi:uncharacterized protein (DUF1501 family)|nr:DUF1501 domain-containing protein [Thermoanaerobaculia bacterium]
MSHSRRDFLLRTTCAALGAAAFQGTVKKFGLANLLATPNSVGGNYRALVCVYMNGGNDSNNLIIPTDSYYTSYASPRPTLAIPLPGPGTGKILPFAASPPSMGGRTFGMHPNTPELVNLFNANKLAVVTNVGPLVMPMSQAEYMNNSKPKPYALFSHSDQVQAWESGRSDIKISTGWGGRSADAVATCNAASGFPTITSIAGSSTFAIGLKRPLSIGTGSLTSVLVLNGFSGSATDVARRSSMDYLRTIDQTATMIAGAASTTQQGVDIGADFSTDPTINTVFPNSGLGNQLKQVAKIIKLVQNSPGLNLSRQIFFVSQGGYDTHTDQLNDQGNNFLDLSASLNAFYLSTVELGLQEQITAFTLSDFARTLQESGTGGSVGTDHGWGSHQLVIGDSVGGGDFWGTVNPASGSIFPVLQTGGVDDTTNSGSSGRGRWIPTSAADQYGATLAKWFGVASSDMGTVFPNQGNFNTMDLGFMGAPPGGC